MSVGILLKFVCLEVRRTSVAVSTRSSNRSRLGHFELYIDAIDY